MNAKTIDPSETDLVERLRDENDRLRAELAALRALSYEDPLTGLKNRRYCDERLAAEVDRARRHGAPVSVVVVDVDDFKAINDTHGHLVGDEVLRWVAAFLASSVREHDVVCRTGGDEFVVILPGVDADGAAHLVARVRRLLARAGVGPARRRLRLSLGAATSLGDVDAADTLLGSADLAMYADKARGRRRPSPLRQLRVANTV